MPISNCIHESQAHGGKRVILVIDEEWVRFSEASEALTAARAERDEWKVMACEYSECLQELCMKRLYDICRPASHAWPGMKHVSSIRMAVEFLIARTEKAEAELAALRAELDRTNLYAGDLTREACRKDSELAALRADAERYRWLRASDNDVPPLRECCDFLVGADLDAAIDAAREVRE